MPARGENFKLGGSIVDKKVILVTGASSGIGKETSKKLIKQEHIVYCVARRVELMDDLTRLGANIMKVDVSKELDCKNCIDKIINEQGKIDVLINNAGFGCYGPIEGVNLEDAKYEFEVNLFGLARMANLVLPYMRRRSQGRIINVSSIGGKVHSPMGGWYHASKFAVEGLSDCLRMETKEFGVDVVLIEPFYVKTAFFDIAMSYANKATNDESPYRPRVMANNTTLKKTSDGKGLFPGLPVSKVANIIVKATSKKRPKTRYMVGNLARIGRISKRLLSDRMYDWLMLKLMANF
ncbi:MAG: oxidoreductase [Oscillospiraceae bacterium]|nr:oxidoreductase [Oscillospiraceae bacterium]